MRKLAKKTVNKIYMHRRSLIFISMMLLLFLAGGLYKLYTDKSDNDGQEIQKILATQNDEEQAKYYRDLIKRVGPVEAQEQLFRSGLPITGEAHLLNHTAGDYIYEEYGLEGITLCRNYFLESCYHGLLLHSISGEAGQDIEEVREIMGYCQRAGVQVPTQCAHAIGHGYYPCGSWLP